MVRLLCLICLALVMTGPASAARPTISLAGNWHCALDPDDVGQPAAWPSSVYLPGSTDEAGLGEPATDPPFAHLQRRHAYVGPAWYQREVIIPRDWAAKRISLFLERCHWESRAFLDGREIGLQDSLSTPHVYELGLVTPGRHLLTLRIDNRLKYNIGNWSHAVTDETQTNWNGVIGRLELQAKDPVSIVRVAATTQAPDGQLGLGVTVRNETGASVAVTLNGQPYELDSQLQTVQLDLPQPGQRRPYDEFNPGASEVTVDLRAGQWRDTVKVPYARRELAVRDGRLLLNGQPHFLRGTLECCIFPRTGYPPCDLASWRRIVRICREYGLNHLRFHSWCPPEAAFAAADEQGFLLQVELPLWAGDVGRDAARDGFLSAELDRILETYGNHPSFAILCLGNELGGDTEFMASLVRRAQQADPRRLYTSSTAWSHVDANDVNISVVRGVRGPGTDHDFRAEDAKDPKPIISHEIGQWMVFPRLAEIRKYNGVLAPRNFEAVRDQLAEHGLLAQAAAFTECSGKLAAELYKEEIEVLLRTPGHAGFQLLDLHDFPGQWTSLVGMLDAFWDSKDLVAPAEWRRFCGPSVPLLRLAKRTWYNDEPLIASAEISHFGPHVAAAAVGRWRMSAGRRPVAAGSFAPRDIATGELTQLGGIEADLTGIKQPTELTITVEVPALAAANSWRVWVYPRTQPMERMGVLVTTDWLQAKATLAAGGRVLLLARGCLKAAVQTRFQPPFWNPIMFRGQPATFGQVIDAKHPALAGFPTARWNDWQWWDVLTGARSMNLEALPPSVEPLARSIDSLEHNRRLANAFEAQVGPGRLLAVSYDLREPLDHKPAAAALRASLVGYLAAPHLPAAQALSAEQLDAVFYDQPLEASPPPDRGLRLRVEAAAQAPALNTNRDWAPDIDRVLTRADGFGYRVIEGSTWKDETDSSWHSGQAVRVELTCPPGWAGSVYALLWDWNSLQRSASVMVEGREVALLDEYDGDGQWVKAAVTTADTADGRIELTATALRGNVMISEIALAE